MNGESQILNIPIEDIIPNRFQPRLNFDENGLEELAASIKEHGIIQPLVLRPLGDKYEIIAGERRFKAAKIANLLSVPALISKMDDKKSAEVAIVENVQRRDLSSIEEAKSYKALLDKGYLTQEELAKKMGLSQSAISNKLRLLSLSEKVQNALMNNQISERHARSLLQIENEEEQEKWLGQIINERLTVRELDTKIKKQLSKPVEQEKKEENTLIEQENNTETWPNYQPTNKFFTFVEEQIEVPTEVEVPESKVEQNEEPEIEQIEEVELLDFLPVDESKSQEDEPNNVDEIINNAIKDLQFINQKVSLEKIVLSDETRYTIIIEK